MLRYPGEIHSSSRRFRMLTWLVSQPVCGLEAVKLDSQEKEEVKLDSQHTALSTTQELTSTDESFDRTHKCWGFLSSTASLRQRQQQLEHSGMAAHPAAPHKCASSSSLSAAATQLTSSGRCSLTLSLHGQHICGHCNAARCRLH